MEDFKWARGLSRSTVANVLNCEATAVNFTLNRKKRVAVCEIQRDDEKGYGIAICSCLDEFDHKKGKNIAARRAVLALAEKKSSRFVRYGWYKFPNTWTKKRIDHIKSFDGMPKCIYINTQEPDYGNMESFIENKLS